MSQAASSPFVFVSYARSDSAYVDRLIDDLQGEGLTVWIDQRGLLPGTPDWEEALRLAIRTAHAVIFIASPNARSSRYVKDELRIAEIFQRPIYPVWIEGVEWMEAAPIGWGGIQRIDARGMRYTTAVHEIAQALKQNLQKISTTTQPQKNVTTNFVPRNPYKGLRPFTTLDTRDFFGRNKLTDELADTLEEMLRADKQNASHARLLAIVGPSGSGKSSIVMAGLLPYLQDGGVQESKDWVYLDPIVPGLHPLESLALTLAQRLPDRSIKAIREDLEDDSARGLHLYACSIVKQRDTKVVVVVDQFEELFTQTTAENERQHFIDLLMSAATEPRGPIIVILTLRADFYDRPMNYPELGKHLREKHQAVLPMSLKELRDVIESPAYLPDVQMRFEGDLVGDILFEIQGQVGALPLLQFTLDQLFQMRKNHLMTLEAYRKIGGVKGALAKHAEMTYASLPTEQHRLLARVLFLRLIDPGSTELDATRRRAPLSELLLPDVAQTAMLQDVANAFVTARLLVSNTIANIATLEVSHEALIREWTRLADWLATNRSDILQQKELGENVAEWIRRGRPLDRLYRGTRLTEAQTWAKRNVPSNDEVAFLQASNAEQEREEKEERTHQERELALQRRATQRQRYVIGMMAVTSVVIVVALVVALVQQGQILASRPVNVTNLNDSGSGSLRNAIADAKQGDTITFARNLSGTITLTSGALNIDKNIAIVGSGRDTFIIDAHEKSRIFYISDGVIAIISNVTIQNGRAEEQKGSNDYSAGLGGGIDADVNSTLVLINSKIVGNTANRSGGGIYSAGSVSISESEISKNTLNKYIASGQSSNVILRSSSETENTSGGGSTGCAGICSVGALSISSSTVSNNVSRADYGTGGISSGSLTLSNSVISRNIGQFGGGIFAGSIGSATITNSTVADNTASVRGGGIYSFSSLFISYSTIAHNSVHSGAVSYGSSPFIQSNTIPAKKLSGGGGGGDGGGIYSYNQLVLEESTVTANKADTLGGGIECNACAIFYSTVYGNTANNGGNIATDATNRYSDVYMENSILAGGKASTGPDMFGRLRLYSANLIEDKTGAQLIFEKNDSDPTLSKLSTQPIIGKSPHLGSLQDNGGSTQTLALLRDSPAIDQVPPSHDCGSSTSSSSYARDQRGSTRPAGKGCDLGAYEYTPSL